MKAVFTSETVSLNAILQLQRLLNFLETCDDKDSKVKEIKTARDYGLIDTGVALDLVVEYC